MKKMKYSFLIIIAALLTSCSTSKYIQFKKLEDEIFTTPDLKSFLASTQNPKVVLRVDNATFNVTEIDNTDDIYSAIENRLLFNGFKVRDRQLFEQIIQNEGNTTDYKELSNQTDTDLIIELINVDFDTEFETNVVHSTNGKTKVDKKNSYEKKGASIEFKVIQIKDNDYAGLYKFNYTPCVEPCYIELSNKDRRKLEKMNKKAEVEAFESVNVSTDIFTEFVKDATDRLILSMRNQN